MRKLESSMPKLLHIGAERLPEVVALHCDAFADYPTMRFVLGPSTPEDQLGLAVLIGYFLDNTFLKGGSILALEEKGQLVAAADAVLSSAPEPPELEQRRNATWKALGKDARSRYEAYSVMTQSFTPAAPHYYLSMLGVRRRCAGRGLARPLLEEVQRLSLEDPESTGVALETETRGNIAFYQHFGYELIGHEEDSDGFESWGFFRPDDGSSNSQRL